MATRVFVAGHLGMVGSAIVRQLSKQLDIALLLASRSELDLTDGASVRAYMQLHKPDQVYLAAAKVGGIYANNTYPAEFIANNLAIQSNVIQAAYKVGVSKLLFLGSSCIYPQSAKQPMSETAYSLAHLNLLTSLMQSLRSRVLRCVNLVIGNMVWIIGV